MSYILDALERAQAQRTQGQVPDLYVRQSVAAAPIGHGGRPWRSMLALGAAATLGALAVGAWLWRPTAVEPAAPPAAVRAPNPLAVAEPLSPPAKPAFHSKATARARAGQSTGTTPLRNRRLRPPLPPPGSHCWANCPKTSGVRFRLSPSTARCTQTTLHSACCWSMDRSCRRAARRHPT
jgi:hypothetical protein